MREFSTRGITEWTAKRYGDDQYHLNKSHMGDDWISTYHDADDLNEKYRILRREMTRLRNELASEFEDDEVDAAGIPAFFDPEAVATTVGNLSTKVEGALVVFAANDFGLPVAFRPSEASLSVQDEIREAILNNKYDDENDYLREIRDELLDRHPEIHKAIVAEYGDDEIEYFLPEGSNSTTNFLTVREMVGLVDYTTNSSQREDLSVTY